ncbi:MAG: tetratricopeptide repeat protein [Ignavibacteriaceae bacterium]
MIVEGDQNEIKNNNIDIITNFYPSQNKDLDKVSMKHYQKGRELIKAGFDTSVEFCTSLLDTLHQETDWGGGTLYSTLYDLNEGIIYLYYNHNFDNAITINIKEELQKENHIIEIPKLFPNNKKGQEFYKNYNETISKIEELGTIETISSSENISELRKFFNNVQKINIYREYFDKVSNKWEETEDFKSAIKVYEVMTMFFPDDYKIYYKLGEANFKLKLYDKALLNYQESSKLVPENEKLKEKIDLVKKFIK